MLEVDLVVTTMVDKMLLEVQEAEELEDFVLEVQLFLLLQVLLSLLVLVHLLVVQAEQTLLSIVLQAQEEELVEMFQEIQEVMEVTEALAEAGAVTIAVVLKVEALEQEAKEMLVVMDHKAEVAVAVLVLPVVQDQLVRVIMVVLGVMVQLLL